MTDGAVESTRKWVQNFVIALDLCPFADHPLRHGRVRFETCDSNRFEDWLESLVREVERLIETPPIELSNTLLVYASAPDLDDFEEFLDLCEAAHAVIEDLGVDHLVQLATFHPKYCFDGADPTDPANATNQSPFPMLHLLRVGEVEDAISRYPDIREIPERNARLLRSREPERQN